MIIRAHVKNGLLEPLDPLPADWGEGETIEIESFLREPSSPEDLERWYRELEAMVRDNPMSEEEYRQIEAILAEADRTAKERVRLEMERS